MTTILEYLAKCLPPALRPFAKAILPALGTCAAVGLQYLASGEFDRTAMTTAITGLSTALVAFLATNHTDREDEPDDVPGADGLALFAANQLGADGAEADEELHADEDELDDVAATNGHADVLLTNGPRT